MNVQKMLETMQAEHEELGAAIKYVRRIAGMNGNGKALRHVERAMAMPASNGHAHAPSGLKGVSQKDAIRTIIQNAGRPISGPEIHELLVQAGVKMSRQNVSVAASAMGRNKGKDGVKRVKEGWVGIKGWTPPETAST